MSEPFIGEIIMFGGNFAPRGFAMCNGQLLSISQNTALFAIIGTTYGGNGQTTFALPDMRGRVPIHPGQGPGLSNYDLGQSAGDESVTLTVNQMPAHTHTLNASGVPATSDSPAGALLGRSVRATIYSGGSPTAQLSGQSISPVGGNQPHTNIQPYLAVTFIICIEGIFPSRN